MSATQTNQSKVPPREGNGPWKTPTAREVGVVFDVPTLVVPGTMRSEMLAWPNTDCHTRYERLIILAGQLDLP